MVIDRFYFSDGSSAGNLEELLNRLRKIDDGCFRHHVNEEKNDFANWIGDELKMKVLAKKIGGLKNGVDIVVAIEKKLNTPTRVKKRIIAQIKGEILDEAF